MRRCWETLLLILLAAPACAADDVRVAAGRALFEAHCTACHGATGDAGASGDIRGLPANVVARATRGMEQMPAFTLSPAELDALVAYLAALAED